MIDELGLRASQVIVAELAVAGLSGGQPAVPLGRTPSRHPVVERDLAVVVAEESDPAEPAAADDLPPELASIPAVKPGSRAAA